MQICKLQPRLEFDSLFDLEIPNYIYIHWKKDGYEGVIVGFDNNVMRDIDTTSEKNFDGMIYTKTTVLNETAL